MDAVVSCEVSCADQYQVRHCIHQVISVCLLLKFDIETVIVGLLKVERLVERELAGDTEVLCEDLPQ